MISARPRHNCGYTSVRACARPVARAAERYEIDARQTLHVTDSARLDVYAGARTGQNYRG